MAHSKRLSRPHFEQTLPMQVAADAALERLANQAIGVGSPQRQDVGHRGRLIAARPEGMEPAEREQTGPAFDCLPQQLEVFLAEHRRVDVSEDVYVVLALLKLRRQIEATGL